MNRKSKSGQAGMVGFGLLLCVLAVAWLVAVIVANVRAGYTFERDYLYQWTLADKSSSIPAKCELITAFTSNLQANVKDFAPNNAVFLKTPDNSFDKNVQALVTLKDRLNEIKGMDPTSFQYNTAIQQVTQQEQGEAHSIISVIQGCYELENYKMAWDWIALLHIAGFIILFVIGCFFVGVGVD